MPNTLNDMREQLNRIEHLLLALTKALIDDQDQDTQPGLSLDGDPLPGHRDQGTPL